MTRLKTQSPRHPTMAPRAGEVKREVHNKTRQGRTLGFSPQEWQHPKTRYCNTFSLKPARDVGRRGLWLSLSAGQQPLCRVAALAKACWLRTTLGRDWSAETRRCSSGVG